MADLQQAMGKVLREERRQQSLTIRSLAEKSSVSVVYLSEIERGVKYPSPQVLERIAAALGLAMPDLLESVADELRPAGPPARDAIGFRIPSRGQLSSRTTIKQLVQMLEPDEVATMGELGVFLLARRSGLIQSDSTSEH